MGTLEAGEPGDRSLGWARGGPEPPTMDDVVAAARRIAPYVEWTPLRRYAALSAELGADVAVKHENLQVTGAFKVRGGVNLVCRLVETALPAGLVAASTGNHGQSVAFAASTAGVPCTICVPEGANPVKTEAIRVLGAEVVPHGARFDDAACAAQELARERGWRFVHSGDEPDLIAGVATAAWEVLQDWPDVDVLVVPVGGGSQAAGTCLVAKALHPRVRVVGVQSEASPSAYRSWKAGSPQPAPSRTLAEGLDTGSPFALPQRMLADTLDEFVLVDDEAILAATARLMTVTKTLVEPTGAAAFAAARALRDELAGRRVALWCSGANIGPEQLAQVAARQLRS